MRTKPPALAPTAIARRTAGLAFIMGAIRALDCDRDGDRAAMPMLALGGGAAVVAPFGEERGMSDPETYAFPADGAFPNSRLPVLVYRAALAADAEAMIRAFAANGWSNAWIDGIFPYHHFHSTAHEVLGIAAGSVDVLLGGSTGAAVRLEAGDAVVIPAGVAHRNVGQRGALRVVGAYPGGADYDLRRGLPEEFAVAARAAGAVSPAVDDPVEGGAGRLRRAWAGPAVSP